MVSYAYLNEANFSKLAHSAESWKLLKKKYDGIGDQFDDQVTKRLKKSWSGKAATKAFDRMHSATKQYENAGIEAHRMGNLMADAHDEFTDIQGKLRTFQDDVAADHFKIHDGTGAIEDIHPNWNSPTASSQPGWGEERRKKQEGYGHRLKEILHHATRLDEGYAAALRADFNGDENMGFNKSGYSSDDKALKAKQDADEAAKLMGKDGPLTKTELDQLDKLLTAHKGDPAFAARFAEKTGVKNTLDAYNEIIDPPPGSNISDAELKRIKSLQEHLGSTLGLATKVDSSAMDKFNQDLLHAVDNNYIPPSENGPYGLSVYQLTSSLMSHGDWDDDLLNSYGDRVITAENQPSSGNPESFWSRHSSSAILGVPPLDPMASFMDALGHNPGASLEFLNGTTETPDGESIDHLDYLMKERKWPEGMEFTGDSKHTDGINTLGHALESATTGAPYDYDGVTMPEHTKAEASLVNDLVTTLGDPENSELMDGKGRLAPLKDSLGSITANYMGDFQRVFGSDTLPVNGAPVGGSHGLSLADTRIFLSEVGQDPEAYKEINASQQGYTKALIDERLAHSSHSDFANTQISVANASTPGTSIAGIMSEARADAVVAKDIAENKDFNSTVDEVNKWVTRGAGIAIGAIASPGAGVVATIGLQEVSQNVVEHLHHDITSEANKANLEAVSSYSKGEQSHETALEAAVRASAQQHGYNADQVADLVETLKRENMQTFGSAAAAVHTRGGNG